MGRTVLGLIVSRYTRNRPSLSSAEEEVTGVMRAHGVGGRGGILLGHMTEASPRKPRPGQGAAGGCVSRGGSPQAEGTVFACGVVEELEESLAAEGTGGEAASGHAGPQGPEFGLYPKPLGRH